MLDPDLIDELAAHPDKNAPAVNLALAEEGHGSVLLSLVGSPATAIDALDAVARRVAEEGDALEPDEDDDDLTDSEPLTLRLDRALIAHPNSSDAARDAVLARHADDPFFVLAAAAHPRATLAAVERAARWPAAFVVYDRRWLALVSPDALPPLTAEAWAQDPDPRLREAVAMLTRDPGLLEALSRDARREVRRAVASNVHAADQRRRLAAEDIAPEVRQRAQAPIGEHDQSSHVHSARFASALRAMQSRGVLAPDVAQSLAASEPSLDEEGAVLAAMVLPNAPLVSLIKQAARRDAPADSATGLAAGLALRPPGDDDAAFRELVIDATKALSGASAHYGTLTGKARLCAWLSDGLAHCRCLDHPRMVDELCQGVLAGEVPVLARGAAAAPALLDTMCARARDAEAIPAALIELAWRSPHIDDARVIAMAPRVAKAKRRGNALPDDEIDLDPKRRGLDVLEQVVLAMSRRVTLAPRSALPVVALDSRRVRYVLTALPSWRGRLSGAMLGQVLRQRAGALSAARSEARSRGAEIRDWTERVLSDIEAAVAIAVGHFTAKAFVDRVAAGRHQPQDGVTLACGAETRAVLQGAEAIQPMLRYAASQRGQHAAALALWLLLEAYDRTRPAAMIASAVDTLAHKHAAVFDTVSDALAILERREPGRLEQIHPQTPRGKATMASAIARAYRAVGGLRDER